MVAYAFVKELPSTLMVVAGCVVAALFVVRSPSASLEPLAAVIGPAIVSALGRRRPAEDPVAKSLGRIGLALLVVRKAFHL